MTKTWNNIVLEKYKKNNKILFNRDSECLFELLELIKLQNHRTLIMWALDCAKIPQEKLANTYPDDLRPFNAIELSYEWAFGIIKMRSAKKAILEVHAMAKELEDKSDIALCHAIGQACSTVHVETHAIGLAFYELSAIVFENIDGNWIEKVEEKINYYLDKLAYWQNNIDNEPRKWADFLQDDSVPNKEKLLTK